MRITPLIATIAAGAALLVGPGLAAGKKPTPPGPNATPAAKAKAYGKHCQGQSKKHVAGQKGTPFSQCVTAMAKLAHDQKMTAKVACKPLSHKHVAGQKGTPYSMCIRAAAQLRAAG
jgi:hypothetical protein